MYLVVGLLTAVRFYLAVADDISAEGYDENEAHKEYFLWSNSAKDCPKHSSDWILFHAQKNVGLASRSLVATPSERNELRLASDSSKSEVRFFDERRPRIPGDNLAIILLA